MKGAAEIIRSLETAEINRVKVELSKVLPEIYVGDTVRVGVRIKEGAKERVQPYEGTVIAMRNGGINETITVRRVFQGVGVERVFLIHSPRIATVQVMRRGNFTTCAIGWAKLLASNSGSIALCRNAPSFLLVDGKWEIEKFQKKVSHFRAHCVKIEI
jgi:large subunit ribosomal protein L19